MLSTVNTIGKHRPVTESYFHKIIRQRELMIISIPFVAYVLLFSYVPLFGWVIAFENYKPALGVLGSSFVGFKKFAMLFTDDYFLKCIRNTLAMGLINLVLGFFFSILIAVFLSETRNRSLKKSVQTISYLPHFLSWIIVTGIVRDVLTTDNGMLNNFLVTFGIIQSPVNWLACPQYFWLIVGVANVWKEAGWGAIIYLAAITAINPDLYEAASIDGAGRLSKIKNVTLPCIKPTFIIMLLISIGNVLNAGFEVQYLLGNGLVQSVAHTIDIYVLKYGISQCDYALGTAAGIFKSVVSIILIFTGNRIARIAGEERLY